MPRILKFSLGWTVAAVTLSACTPETVVPTENIPTAGVRFIHAVPDTGTMDFRFVDLVENNAQWNVAFRNSVVIAANSPASTYVQYKPARAGQRHFRIFMHGDCSPTSCNQALATQVVKDTTVTLAAGRLYTALLWGYANPTGPNRPAGAPPLQLAFFEETVADASPQVSVRVINTAEYAVNVGYYRRADSSATAPAAMQWSNVAPLSRMDHITVAPDTLLFTVRASTAPATPLFGDRRAMIGAAAIPPNVAPGPIDAVPGTMVPGSAVTAIVWPRSVAGSTAAASTTPSISFVWDRRPPRPPGS